MPLKTASKYTRQQLQIVWLPCLKVYRNTEKGPFFYEGEDSVIHKTGNKSCTFLPSYQYQKPYTLASLVNLFLEGKEFLLTSLSNRGTKASCHEATPVAGKAWVSEQNQCAFIVLLPAWWPAQIWVLLQWIFLVDNPDYICKELKLKY